MAVKGWRYLVFSAPAGDYLGEVALTNVTISRVLSGPGRLTGRLRDSLDQLALLKPWAVTVWAEDPRGIIRGGGILTPLEVDEHGVQIDAMGLSGYPDKMPWIGATRDFYVTDACDVVREIWDHLQGEAGGNLGVEVDPLRCGVTVGTRLHTDAQGNEVEPQPYRLSFFETHDLLSKIDELAGIGGFEYLERTEWAPGGTKLRHRLRLGKPTVGARHSGVFAPRLTIGENVAVVPTLVPTERCQVATGVLALGAGEGPETVNGRITHARSADGLRKVVVLSDKSITHRETLMAWARGTLDRMSGRPTPNSLDVVLTDETLHSAIEVGDEVLAAGAAGLVELDCWVRVTQLDYQPETSRMQATVEVI